jgi:hypothetical protein
VEFQLRAVQVPPKASGFDFNSALFNWEPTSPASSSMNLYIYKYRKDVVASATDKLSTVSGTTPLVIGVMYLNGSMDYKRNLC